MALDSPTRELQNPLGLAGRPSQINVGEHGVDGRLYVPAGAAPRRREIDHERRFLD